MPKFPASAGTLQARELLSGIHPGSPESFAEAERVEAEARARAIFGASPCWPTIDTRVGMQTSWAGEKDSRPSFHSTRLTRLSPCHRVLLTQRTRTHKLNLKTAYRRSHFRPRDGKKDSWVHTTFPPRSSFVIEGRTPGKPMPTMP